jgi:hypothetical protein
MTFIDLRKPYEASFKMMKLHHIEFHVVSFRQFSVKCASPNRHKDLRVCLLEFDRLDVGFERCGCGITKLLF